MPAKIRLARHGKKKFPYYHIVIADSRAPRDGRFIERIGMYNPNTNPATIELDFDSALKWLQKGAQITDTCKAILSYKGVVYKNHLLKGVANGALTAEAAEAKFREWLQSKEAKVQAKRDRVANEKENILKKQVASETKVREIKTQAIAKKNAKAAEAEKQEAAAENTEQITEQATEQNLEQTNT
ncbi:MAG: 30S ribosomal protein S16 [Bacteroidia bacterium]|nr:30S ribosomal protein S16 [Bacteroidia bacterium]